MVTFVVDLLAVKLVSICTVHATVAVLQLPIVKVIFILFFTICWILYHEKDTFIGTSNIYFIDKTDLEVC